MIEEEQEKELKREDTLKSAEGSEQREKLEMQFGIERAKASERIIKLSEQHDKILRSLK